MKVDDYVDTVVKKGTILYRGEPNANDYIQKGILVKVDNITVT